MPKKDSCRKWFCRVTKINNTQNGVYEYNFDDLYNIKHFATRTIQKYSS